MEVVLTLFGTPRWANGGKAPNVMPRRVADFGAFARAIASRYSGRFDGYPFVRFWTVWNEPNLQLFLTPQFDRREVGRAGELRAAVRGRLRGGQGREPARARRDRRDVARGTDKPGASARALSGQVHRGDREGQPGARVRRLVAPPVPVQAQPEPVAEGRWPNVTLGSLPTLDEPEAALQAEVRADLGHGVRARDEAGTRSASRTRSRPRTSGSRSRSPRTYPFVPCSSGSFTRTIPGQPWDSPGIHADRAPQGQRRSARFCVAAKPARQRRNAILLVQRGTTPWP